MRISFISILFFVAHAVLAQELQRFYNEGMAAYKAKDYALFYAKMKEAHKLHPYHQGVLYQLGMAAALTGKKTEAIQNLKQAILIDADFRLMGIADFNSIKDSPEFKKLLILQKEWQSLLIHSDTAFTIKDRSLHPEGIEYDAARNTFYLGSIHQRKVVRVTADGKVTDFCSAGFQGMSSVLGIKADVKRNKLWICSSPLQEMEKYDSNARSAVFQFELSSGKLVHQYQSALHSKNGVYGDLIISKNGNVFISDSQNNDITTINQKTNQIEPFYSSPEFWNIQGMAFSTDEKFLFIADYVKGIFRLELKTKKLIEVATPADVSSKGIDGIYYYNNSLVATQNGVVPSRSTRFSLNKELDSIVNFEIIDRKHPAFGEPTLGVIVDHTFYYIANSQWGGYDNLHHIKPDNQLKDIVILKAVLR